MLDPWNLYPVQSLVASAFFKFKHICLMLPRQEGKTELGCRLGHSLIANNKSRQGIFLTKSRGAAEKMTREKYNRIFPVDRFRVNTELIYNKDFPEACIYIDSVDKRPDKLRGGSYHYIHWAEVAFSEFEKGIVIGDFLERVIKPTQRKTHGYSLLESTPNGPNGWADLFQNARSLGFVPIVFSLSKLVEMGLQTEAEYRYLKATTPDLVFRQEYECEFVVFEGVIYKEFLDHLIWKDMPPPSAWQMCVFAVDWGYDPSATCVLFAYVLDGRICVFDEIYDKFMLIDDIKTQIKAKYNAWGITRQTGVGDHDPRNIEELVREGIAVEPADKTNVLGARLEIKSRFLNDNLFIHPRCTNLIKDLLAATWDKKKHGELNDKVCTWGHFDAESALRYLVRAFKGVEIKAPRVVDSANSPLALESFIRG